MFKLSGYLTYALPVLLVVGCSPTENAPSFEENKAIARIYERVVSERNVDILDQAFAPNYRYHGPGLELNLAELKEHVGGLMQMFPDMRLNLELQIAEGDYVATRFVVTGTNTGEVEGMPATGKTARITGVYILRIVEGKVVEEWEDYDEAGMLRQLGVLPAS